MKTLSLPATLWIASGLIAIAGVQTWRLHSLESEHAQLEAEVAKSRAARATAYADDSDKTANKEQAHAQTTQGVSDVFTQGQSQRNVALRNDLQRARRLLNTSEQRAAGYRTQAEAGAVACGRLADRSAALDRQLAAGVGVVADLRGVIDKRDVEVVLQRGVIDADRKLFAD